MTLIADAIKSYFKDRIKLVDDFNDVNVKNEIMKYTEFKIEEDIIEFHNSVFGKETIYVNGKNISENYSIIGINHKFEYNNNFYELKSIIVSFFSFKVNLELRKNNNLIDTKIIKTPVHQTIIFLLFGIAIGFAMNTINF